MSKKTRSRPTWRKMLKQLEVNLEVTREELWKLLEELGLDDSYKYKLLNRREKS